MTLFEVLTLNLRICFSRCRMLVPAIGSMAGASGEEKSQSLGFLPSRFANQENARTEIRVLLAQFVGSFEVRFRNDVGLQQAVPLEVGQGFEEDAGAMDHIEPR